MKKTIFSALAFATLVGWSAHALAETAEISQTTYRCDRDVIVPATYINHKDESSIVVLFVEGKQIVLRLENSASGERYAPIEREDGYIWWTKGETAFLFYVASDSDKTETDVIKGCQSQDDRTKPPLTTQ